MVAPVTGPYVSFPSLPYEDNFRRGYRQKMPIDRPLEYRMYRYYGEAWNSAWYADGRPPTSSHTKDASFSVSGSFPQYGSLLISAQNRAYEKLRGAAGEQSGWAENIAQINKTRATIVERSVQLAKFAGALRKGRFGDAARILRTPKPSGVSNRKAASQNFLEWEYGVKPVIHDLQSSMKTLLGEPEPTVLYGSAQEYMQYVSTQWSSSSSTYAYTRDVRQGTVTVKSRVNMVITNPNVFLANQLGLIDLALPWKLIPFSFVADWFVNVEQCISATTDWYGVSLQHPQSTRFARGTRQFESFVNVTVGSASEGSKSHSTQESIEMWRDLAFSGPTFQLKPFKGFSIERGAQAIALVLSALGK